MKAVSSLLVGCCAACCPAAFADLHYSVVANTGDVATGSRAADGRPDGVFTFAANIYEFEAPAAGSAGFAAFRAAAQMEPLPPRPSVLRGLWAAGPGGLSAHLLTDRSAPASGGGFTGTGGDSVMNESGDTAFWGQWINPNVQPNITGTGLWWSRAGAGAVPALEPVAISGTTGPGSPEPFSGFTVRPLHNGHFIGFPGAGANWVFDKTTAQLRRVSWAGMEAPSFGAGVTLTTSGTILGMDESGRFLLQGTASDGGTWLFRAGGATEVAPVFKTGQDAPGLPGRQIGAMAATVNHRGEVAMLTRLSDGDANPLNDVSALYAGPEGAVALVAQGGDPLPGMTGGLWGGQPLLGREGHLLAAGGLLRLPRSPEDELTFTALPPIPGATGFPDYSLNARGQVAASVLIGNAASLWLFNPGDGWLEVARAGQSLALPGGAVTVSKIAVLTGSAGGDGKASGLANDGLLCFALNGRLIVSADANPATGFVFHGSLGNNWHASGADPPTNWNATNGAPREDIPGDIGQHTAEVTIPPGFAVVLDQRAAPIGQLNAAGTLTLQQALTVHRDSVAEHLTVTGAAGRLAVDGAALEMTGDLRVENGASVDLTDATLTSRGNVKVSAGAVNAAGAAAWQHFGLLEKSGSGTFAIAAALRGFEATAGRRWGLDVLGGTLALNGGGGFTGQHALHSEGTLRLTGDWTVSGGIVCDGPGVVELGDPALAVAMSAGPGDAVVFEQSEGDILFRRGRLEGDGLFLNRTAFSWEGGTLETGDFDAASTIVGGFRNDGQMEIPDAPVSPRILRRVLRNRGSVTQTGAITLSDATLVQDADQAVWTLKGGTIEGAPADALFDHQRGRLIAENNSEIHARYEGGANSTLLVRDTLTMFGGADWQDRSLDLESDFSELRLDAPPGPPKTYTLRHALDEDADISARLTVRNAVLRLPRNRFIHPLLTLEEGSQITTFSPPAGATNFDDGIKLRHAVWRGGTMGGPVTTQDLILLPDETTIEGSADHILDATLVAGNVIQRSPVSFTDRGFVVIDRSLTKVARWVIRAPVGLSGNGMFRNGGTLIAEPDPPGLVEIGLRLSLLKADFICGSPDRDNTGTILRFTNTNEARPAPGDALVSGSWIVYRGAVLDAGGPAIHRIARAATVEITAGTFAHLDPRQNEGRFTLRGGGTDFEISAPFTNTDGARLEVTNDAILRVRDASVNHGSIRVTLGGEMTVDGPFTQGPGGKLHVGFLSFLRLPGGGVLGGTTMGAGELIGNVTLPGRTSPGTSPGQLTITGTATLAPTSVFEAEVSGAAAGQFDVLNVSGAATVDGTLEVVLLNGFRPSAADVFPVIQAGTLAGRFANAPPGQRLATVDGYGSFVVSYTGAAVVISDFAANPDPSPSVLPTLPAPEILFGETSTPLLSFHLSGSPGRPYHIESSPSLRTWTPFHSAVPPSTGAQSYEFPFDPANSPSLYYRARAE